MGVETIYMPLLNEGTTTWAPVQAERWSDDSFLVPGPVPAGQIWRFGPDCVVSVEAQIFSDGSQGLVATRFVGVPAIMARGWDGVDDEINKIIAAAAEPFDAATIANVQDVVEFLRRKYPPPDAVDRGYRNTVFITWGNFEIEIFGDSVEGYRYFDGHTDIWEDKHKVGDSFSTRFVDELAALEVR